MPRAPGARGLSAVGLALAAAALARGAGALRAAGARAPARGANSTRTSAAHLVTPASALAQIGQPDEGNRDRGVAKKTLSIADLTPPQFLIISSPREKKIVYTELKDFRSTTGRTFTLIDTGLQEPCDIAFDHQRGDLYVADRLQKTVFRYGLLVDAYGGGYRLRTDGSRVTVLVNRKVRGLTVDVYGTVFFTDEVSRSINKISAEVVSMLGASDLVAEDLGVISESQLENASSSRIASSMNAGSQSSADEPRPAPVVQALYEEVATPHVSAPTGIASDGMRLYWANGKQGQRRGVVVEGEVQPQSTLLVAEGGAPGHFPVTVLASNADAAHGLVQTSSMLVFSGESRGSGAVFGVGKSGGPVFRYASGLGQPRGLAWDGDSTVYVADAERGRVYSLPVNRRTDGAPLAPAVDFSGAHGLALASGDDAAWARLRSRAAGRAALPPRAPLLLPLLAAALAARARGA